MKTLTIFATTFLLVLVASALPAAAGTVTIQFNSAAGNSYGGAYSYPYFATVDKTPFEAMCISFNEHITNGETWQATVYTTAEYGAFIHDTVKANELAWLFLQEKANGGSNPGYNAAAWYLNEPVLGLSFLDPNATNIYNQVTGNVEFGNLPVYFYVPTSNEAGWTDGTPQTFMGATPEPGTLLTLGTAVIGLAGLARKRLFS